MLLSRKAPKVLPHIWFANELKITQTRWNWKKGKSKMKDTVTSHDTPTLSFHDIPTVTSHDILTVTFDDLLTVSFHDIPL